MPFDFNTYIPYNINPNEYSSEAISNMIQKMNEKKVYTIVSFTKEFHIFPSRLSVYTEYVRMVKLENFQRNKEFEIEMRSKRERSDSGVQVFTLLMSDKPDGGNFTCKYNCHYCPKEPNMARSYLSKEPAVRRGHAVGWDPVEQIFVRFQAYIATGQVSAFEKEIVKGEFILEGGTFSSYPEKYCDTFMRDIYYACNTIYDAVPRRERMSLEEEMKINVSCVGIRVIGMSIETRPDNINRELLYRLRTYGVTKIQIGVQHTDDEILRFVNRGCYDADTRRSMKVMLSNGFKVQIHLMPDLPTSSPEKDVEMFKQVFSDSEYGFDHLKIYPTMVVPYTRIKKWYDQGTYKPYGDDHETILNVLVNATQSFISNERYDIRIERVVRDFDHSDIEGGTSDTGMGDVLTTTCINRGIFCCCIRCREIKGQKIKDEPILVRRDRVKCGSTEVFLSFESPNQKIIYGFLRMRLPSNNDDVFFDELLDSAIIREVHVYGTSSKVGQSATHVQGKGFGYAMVAEAKSIACLADFKRIAVISGNGVKDYYRKYHGFVDNTYFMTFDF